MTHIFDRTILREYDIRGIVGKTLNEEDAYALGRTFAALATDEGATTARRRPRRPHPLARARSGADPRPDRRRDQRAATSASGPARCSISPSPRLSVQGGIQVTGSHNPPDYNGFKMLLNGRSVFGEEIQKLGRRAADGDWTEGHGHVEQVDVLDAYVDRLVQDFQGGAFRIGWDAGQRRRRSGAREAHREAAGRASRDPHRRSTAPFRTIIPIRRSKPISPT